MWLVPEAPVLRITSLCWIPCLWWANVRRWGPAWMLKYGMGQPALMWVVYFNFEWLMMKKVILDVWRWMWWRRKKMVHYNLRKIGLWLWTWLTKTIANNETIVDKIFVLSGWIKNKETNKCHQLSTQGWCPDGQLLQVKNIVKYIVKLW